MLNRQFDAAVTSTSGQGEISEGFSRGNIRSMVDRKLLKMSDIRIIWLSGKIPNGPWTVRADLPQGLKQTLTALMLDLPESHRDIYNQIEKGTGSGYAPASMDLYQDIIDLRLAEQRANRS